MAVRMVLVLWLGFWNLDILGARCEREFRDVVTSSDVIAEGKVIEQTDINQNAKWNTDVCRKQSIFKISHLYKGDFREGQSLSVLSDFGFICNTSRLEKGGQYLLLLEHRPEGFADIGSGQGTFEIIDLGPHRQAVVGSMSFKSGFFPLDQFRKDLLWALAGPNSSATGPAIDESAALAIAGKLINQTGIDLSDYRASKPKPFKANYDFIGVAYKGDSMWFIQWEPLSPASQKPHPAESAPYGYVNARTGKAFCGPKRPNTGLSIPDKCRAFLATYSPIRKTYQGAIQQMTAKFITEEEFTGYLPCAKKLLVSPKPNHPEGTVFLVGEFPKPYKIQPVLFVLDEGRNIEYAGILQETKKAGAEEP
jgi:hypothetical protein